MRYGFTTGSCAAAAAKAAAYMLISGKKIDKISIDTPKGIRYDAAIENLALNSDSCSCSVKKDGGDDPDITSGADVYALVRFGAENENLTITIRGGKGVGRVTLPGLDQPVGEAAINHVPREMITKEVTEVCKLLDYMGELIVEISVPQGIELAKKTFNPKLGIVDGISILGTSGIVEAMSSEALIQTIKVEISQKRALGREILVVAPGNYGQDYILERFNYDIENSVKCSNYIGASIDFAREYGFKKFLFVGHIGKLIKVSGGMMNTHSREGDCRMELLSSLVLKAGGTSDLALKVLECISTDAAIDVIDKYDIENGTTIRNTAMELMLDKILYYLGKRADNEIEFECIVFGTQAGTLVESKRAKEWFISLEQDPAQQI